MDFEHIVYNLDVMGGKPCIRGTRISVDVLLEWLANGADRAEILASYPQISTVAFSQALHYAAQQARGDIYISIPVAA